MKEFKIGYTQGVFDLFHIGHLNLLKRAKERCDYLVVGVNGDDLVEAYKNKRPVIPEEQRMRIVEAIKYVDRCIIVGTLDKKAVWEEVGFDAVFIGDDWKGSERWIRTEEEMKKIGVKVIYLPRTDGICSSDLAKNGLNRGEYEIFGNHADV